MLKGQFERLDDLRRVFGQVEQSAFFDSRSFGARFTVGFPEQDLLVGFGALFGLDTLNMHDVYPYRHKNHAK